MTSVIKEILEQAERFCCESVAIPAISSGIFGYPKDECASTIMDALEDYAKNYKDKVEQREYLKRVTITILDNLTFGVFEKEFNKRYHHQQHQQ